MIFRFDDVCINADMGLINRITDYMFKKHPDCQVIWGVSPLVYNDCGQRVYPQNLNALSDYREFFRPQDCGLPPIRKDVTLAGHGLIHIDHRLLDKQAQEMSILASCSLIGATTFIPPFNKWNQDTENICIDNSIELIKFEDGWRSMEYNKFDKKHERWYLHAREWTFKQFKTWLDR